MKLIRPWEGESGFIRKDAKGRDVYVRLPSKD